MASTFPKFSELPIEVRLIIWGFATNQRVVTLASEGYTPWWTGAETFLRHARPSLLDVCHESREFALKKYGSVFTPKDGGWEWTGSKKMRDLRTVLKCLGLSRGGSIINMLERISMGLNKPEEAKRRLPKFATVGKFALHPLWFDTANDVLLLNYQLHSGFSAALWGPWSSRKATKLQNVAFYYGNYWQHYPHGLTIASPSAWLSRLLKPSHPQELPVPADFSTDVKSITFLIPKSGEIITITLDQDNLLEPGQWSYSLDTQSETFAEMMGVYWSKVTWDVRLARNREHTLWEIALCWTPDMQKWKNEQRQLCQHNNEIVGMWRSVNGHVIPPLVPPPLLLLENGDGKTYVGPLRP